MDLTIGTPVKDTPRFEGDTILCGVRYPIFRGDQEVATAYEHPTKYRGGLCTVSLRSIVWAGKFPHGLRESLNNPCFHDFVSEHTSAKDVLPQLRAKLEGIDQWRKENA